MILNISSCCTIFTYIKILNYTQRKCENKNALSASSWMSVQAPLLYCHLKYNCQKAIENLLCGIFIVNEHVHIVYIELWQDFLFLKNVKKHPALWISLLHRILLVYLFISKVFFIRKLIILAFAQLPGYAGWRVITVTYISKLNSLECYILVENNEIQKK